MKLPRLFRRRPKTPEDIAAEQEAKQLEYERETIKLSQFSSAGQNYQSGRGSRH